MERGIVSQILALAKDPANRSIIVKDQGCLPGLVLFLDHKDMVVIETAVQALTFLAENQDNRNIMWKEIGLVVSLNAIVGNSSMSDATRQGARTILDAISPLPQPVSTNDWATDGLGKKSRTVTLQIKGLDDLLCRKQIEEVLLAMKGIVSFTFDMKLQRTDVRARVDLGVEEICSAIATTKSMTASQIVKTEEGKEVVLSFGKTPSTTLADKENMGAKKPLKYLDDETVPDAVISAKAVARVGDAGKAGGWLGSIGSYLSKSLYW